MTSNEPLTADSALCPLCGRPNDCQLCTTAAYKGPCWCMKVKIPDELLARIPPEARRRACLCRDCVTAFHQERADENANGVVTDDFYFEAGGLMVFTETYLRRRGCCCANGCRHCPYPPVNATPQRIVCLSAEAADWLWRIGAWEQVVGVTAYFVPPTDAPAKPRVSGFSTANLAGITRLDPDLVITFSDVQAELAAALMRLGLPVLATNQRTLAETETTLAMLARIVGREVEGESCRREFRARLAPVETVGRRPRVYFEEWNDPLISGIAWVSELIERAGGEDVFSELRPRRSAAERVVAPEQILRANPEIIFASWCGEPFEPAALASRPGWTELSAVRAGRIYEIAGADILQPGFRLVHGYELLKERITVAARAFPRRRRAPAG